MNVLHEHVTGHRWTPRRRKETGARRRCGGSDLASTPCLEWELHGGDSAREIRRQQGGHCGAPAAVSARKLAASLWRLAETTEYCGIVRRRRRLLDGLRFESCSSLPIPKIELEGVTKWDYCNSKASFGDRHFLINLKLLKNEEIETISVASARQAELYKARKRINELEAEQNWATTKLKQCAKIKHLKDDIIREKKIFKKINFLNSKLVNDIAKAKLLAMKFKKNFEKEKKAREFLVDLCSDLAKDIEGKKGEIVALKSRCGRIEKEVEEERKMLQLAEVWREERAQMKLVDAKLILEEKYCQMNNLIADMETFLRSSNLTSNCDQESHKSTRGEISPVSLKQRKKKSSPVCKATNISSSGRISNGSISSIDDVAVEDKCIECQWPAREPRNPHIVRAMKGEIQWPRRIQRQGLRGNILEAKLGSQKMLLRNVLKQKS
ncbi:hypothetical protein BUALT_Bualt03G0076300 [Buddleja alternifolia]|uniref:Uncharacterized protein n=1 Tax=Buddleja alternifolia TaxID=168488 RepID=A0AAV6XYL3_9LAMI|nr:hypothetical protein BUALT_Bualt03G0076300 [Buddleja alternifolia]